MDRLKGSRIHHLKELWADSRGRSGIRIIFAFDPTRSALLLKDLAATLGVSTARISQIEHGDVTIFEVIARYVEALGGRLDLVADLGDRTVRLPSATPPTPPHHHCIPAANWQLRSHPYATSLHGARQ